MVTRVVVTGMGLLTSLGNDVASTWEALCQGRSGVALLTCYDTSQFRVHFGAEVKNFDPLLYMDWKEIRHSDPYQHFAVAVVKQALAQSELRITEDIAEHVGVYIGSGMGGLTTFSEAHRTITEQGPQQVDPHNINTTMINGASGMISIMTRAHGPCWAAISAFATGSNTIGEAWETIRRGDTKVMIAGGAEKSIVPIAAAAFDNMHALSRRNDDPQRASRPFDATRDGFVIGEGAGALILEELGFARARGAHILAEIVGYGSTSDAYHITAPPPGGTGLARALHHALKKARLRPDEIDYISAHGTSTPYNDQTETQAIKICFREQAYRIPISSIKSMIGHALGAAGAIEAVISIMALLTGIIPPTINLHTPDPECDLDYVPNQARQIPIKTVVSNSMGFGGHNVALIFKRFEE